MKLRHDLFFCSEERRQTLILRLKLHFTLVSTESLHVLVHVFPCTDSRQIVENEGLNLFSPSAGALLQIESLDMHTLIYGMQSMETGEIVRNY